MRRIPRCTWSQYCERWSRKPHGAWQCPGGVAHALLHERANALIAVGGLIRRERVIQVREEH
eukprot:3512863-Pyramimonas_sp.AAC.1